MFVWGCGRLRGRWIDFLLCLIKGGSKRSQRDQGPSQRLWNRDLALPNDGQFQHYVMTLPLHGKNRLLRMVWPSQNVIWPPSNVILVPSKTGHWIHSCVWCGISNRRLLEIDKHYQGRKSRGFEGARAPPEPGAAPQLFASGGKISYLYRSLHARGILVGTIT